MNKTPEQMTIIELKALIFDLKNDAEICIQILNKKIMEERQKNQMEMVEIVELNKK